MAVIPLFVNGLGRFGGPILQKYESIAARPMPNTDLAWGAENRLHRKVTTPHEQSGSQLRSANRDQDRVPVATGIGRHGRS